MSNSTSDMSYLMGKVFIRSLTQNLDQHRDLNSTDKLPLNNPNRPRTRFEIQLLTLVMNHNL